MVWPLKSALSNSLSHFEPQRRQSRRASQRAGRGHVRIEVDEAIIVTHRPSSAHRLFQAGERGGEIGVADNPAGPAARVEEADFAVNDAHFAQTACARLRCAGSVGGRRPARAGVRIQFGCPCASTSSAMRGRCNTSVRTTIWRSKSGRDLHADIDLVDGRHERGRASAFNVGERRALGFEPEHWPIATANIARDGEVAPGRVLHHALDLRRARRAAGPERRGRPRPAPQRRRPPPIRSGPSEP